MISWLTAKMRKSPRTEPQRGSAQKGMRTRSSASGDSKSQSILDLDDYSKQSVGDDDVDEIAVAGLAVPQPRKRGRPPKVKSDISIMAEQPIGGVRVLRSVGATSSTASEPVRRNRATTTRTASVSSSPTPVARQQISQKAPTIYTRRQVTPKSSPGPAPIRSRKRRLVENEEDEIAGKNSERTDSKKRKLFEIHVTEVGSSDPEEQGDDPQFIGSSNEEESEILTMNGAQESVSGQAAVSEQPPNEPLTPDPESAMSDIPEKLSEKSIPTTSSSISAISLNKVKRRVLAQLNGRLPIPIVGLDEAYKKIYNILEQTILAPMLDVAIASSRPESSWLSSTKFHGGNSALLLGPRASGKSLMITTALAELESKYKGQFIVVRLSGFAQTDDKQALQEIAAQIEYGIKALDEDESLYVNVEDDVTESPTKAKYKRQSSVVVLERLLSLFSGRAGVRDDNEERISDQQSPAKQPVVSVLIILDEFERFATMQNRQTLLYNLLDVAQSPRYSLKTDARAPNICIIGVSSRMTAPEMLEKRVRSRFSHRVVVLPHSGDVESFWKVCSSGLKVTSAPTVAIMTAMVNSNRHTRVTARPKKSEYSIERRATEVWNAYIDNLYLSSPEVRRVVDLAFATSRDPRQVHMEFLTVVGKASQIFPFVPTSEIGCGHGVNGLENAGIMEKVGGLSELSLMLLICAARAEIKYATTVPALTSSPTKKEHQEIAIEGSPAVPSKSSQPAVTKMAAISFTLAYEEYLSQAGKTRLAEASAGALITMPFRVWSREQAVGAWEALERIGLVVNVSDVSGGGGGGGGSTGRGGNAISEMQAPEIGLMELGEVVKDMRGVNSVVRQWCSSL
ncbi:origin recognition complex subunit 4 C-terminus-domain-containing protein [Lipomyces kononenkoae]